MATVSANVNESVYNIKRWLGVNEAPEGEASLRFGEASVCRNFRVTSGGALQKRPGSKTVAKLTTAYNVLIDDEPRTLLKEFCESGAEFAMAPRVKSDSAGNPVMDGETVTVTAENASEYVGYYCMDDQGAVWRFRGCEARERTEVRRSSVSLEGPAYTDDPIRAYFLQCDEITWDGTDWTLTNPTVTWGPAAGKLTLMSSETFPVVIYAAESAPPGVEQLKALASPDESMEGIIGSFGYDPDGENWWNVNSDPWFKLSLIMTSLEEAHFYWRFSETSTSVNEAGTAVRGLWSGFVGGREVICAACNGHLWELKLTNGEWEKVSCGLLGTDNDVCMFGFEEKLYILNGDEYMVWDGVTLMPVEGYRPIVTISVPPEGGGTELERVNLLSGARRSWFSPDGESLTFTLPEGNLSSLDYVRDIASGGKLEGCTADLEEGTVTFDAPPQRGTNTLEIAWSVDTKQREQVTSMRYAELYNGAQDTRVFLYGDGSNRTIYSGLDHDGNARADYFPELNEASVGDANTPITAMIRHYNRLLCFKLDSAWSMGYETITLPDGRVTAGFTVTPVNRDVGNCAMGQACLVENRPRTIDGRSVIEWKSGSNGNITGDQRNAERVSQRVERSMRDLDLESARAFYDKLTHEYYVYGTTGTALVNNVEVDAWYTYTAFPAVCMLVYKDEVYYGTAEGTLVHFSDDCLTDDGRAVEAVWESGAMDFGADFRRKNSAMLWVGIRPERAGYLAVTAETDRRSDFAEYSFTADNAGAVPEMERVRLKAKKFTYYKLRLVSDRADTAATVVSADIRVRGTGFVR